MSLQQCSICSCNVLMFPYSSQMFSLCDNHADNNDTLASSDYTCCLNQFHHCKSLCLFILGFSSFLICSMMIP